MYTMNNSRLQAGLLSDITIYARYYYFQAPGMPTLDLDHAECCDIMCRENCFSFEASNEYKNVNHKVTILILAS